MEYVIVFVLGFLGAFLYDKFFNKTKEAGTLYFYENEPGEDPIMTAVLNQSVEEVMKCDQVTFKVSHK